MTRPELSADYAPFHNNARTMFTKPRDSLVALDATFVRSSARLLLGTTREPGGSGTWHYSLIPLNMLISRAIPPTQANLDKDVRVYLTN